jgi:hypothetical protein
MDLTDFSYVHSLQEEFDIDESFVGGPNRRWQRWKTLLPDRPDIWNELLRRRWRDKKLDPMFDYPQAPPPSAAEAAKLAVPLQEMWSLGCLEFEQRPDVPGAILHQFGRDKPGTVCPVTGGPQIRVVLDGGLVSTNEDVPSYKGPTVQTQLRWVQRNDWLLRTDLSKMYWQIEARPSQRIYQRVWVGNRLARLTCAGMGWKGVPRWAQTMMSSTSQLIQRRFNMTNYTYMDEWLASGRDPLEGYLSAKLHREMLTFQGWRMNWKKSDQSFPTQSTEFCGIHHHTAFITVAPTQTRLLKVRETALKICQQYHQMKPTTGWLLASILGQINSLLSLHQQAGFRVSRLSAIRAQFQRRFGPTRTALRHNFIPRKALAWSLVELIYWSQSNPNDEWRFQPKQDEMWDSVITVDSSMWGFAAETATFYTQGHFNRMDRQRHHCTLEFLGGALGRAAFYKSPAYNPGHLYHHTTSSCVTTTLRV